jgi:hypothetical protein
MGWMRYDTMKLVFQLWKLFKDFTGRHLAKAQASGL